MYYGQHPGHAWEGVLSLLRRPRGDPRRDRGISDGHTVAEPRRSHSRHRPLYRCRRCHAKSRRARRSTMARASRRTSRVDSRGAHSVSRARDRRCQRRLPCGRSDDGLLGRFVLHAMSGFAGIRLTSPDVHNDFVLDFVRRDDLAADRADTSGPHSCPDLAWCRNENPAPKAITNGQTQVPPPTGPELPEMPHHGLSRQAGRGNERGYSDGRWAPADRRSASKTCDAQRQTRKQPT